MGIEQALAAMTAAVKENSELLRQHLAAKGAEPVAAPAESIVVMAAEPTKAENAKAEPVAAPAEPVKAEVKYADVQKALTAYLTANGKEATLKVLAGFGVTTATKLSTEQYADVVAAFGAAA